MKEEVLKRILIVDDDIDLLMLLERRLQKAGYEIETAISLPEAEELIIYFEPHLILLDINVNGFDGRHLSWKVKNRLNPQTKIIIISGFDYSPRRAALFGADEILPKPLNTDTLLQKIDHLISQQYAD